MKTILCFGDSNTWGYVPGSDGERYGWETRWPGVLQSELGSGYRVIEEGLNGRTAVLDSPFVPHRNGRDYLLPCLQSHMPLDLVVVFLGTNELQDYYGMPAQAIAYGSATLAELALKSETGPEAGPPKVLLCSLPRLGTLGEGFSGAVAKARDLPRHLRACGDELGVPVLDLAESVAYSDLDGIHLDADGHRAVGLAVARAAPDVLD